PATTRSRPMVARRRGEAVQALQANRSGIIGRGQRHDRPDGGPRWTTDLGQVLSEASALWGEEPAAGGVEAIDMAAAGEVALRWPLGGSGVSGHEPSGAAPAAGPPVGGSHPCGPGRNPAHPDATSPGDVRGDGGDGAGGG